MTEVKLTLDLRDILDEAGTTASVLAVAHLVNDAGDRGLGESIREQLVYDQEHDRHPDYAYSELAVGLIALRDEINLALKGIEQEPSDG